MKQSEKYPTLPAQVTAVPDEAQQQADIETAAPTADEPTQTTPRDEVKLSRAVKIKDVETDTVKISLDKLTGAMVTRAERMFRLKCPDYPDDQNVFSSMTFWMILGSIAADIPYSTIEEMPMLDALAIAGVTRTVFFGQ